MNSALDSFSRLYLLGLVAAVISSMWIVTRIEIRCRQARSFNEGALPAAALLKANRSLHAIFSLGALLAAAWFATQVLAIDYEYVIMRRVDLDLVDPFGMTWFLTQVVVGILLVLHAARWRADAIVARLQLTQAAISLK